MNVVAYLVTPDPTLNYGFISKVFAALSLVSAAFFIAQYYFDATSVQGFWIVPAPTLPALFYALFLDGRSIKNVRGRAARTAKKAE